MNIGIDIRALVEQHWTGVGEFTYEFLDELFKTDKKNQYFLFYNSYKDVDIPKWSGENIHIVRTRIPNKIFNILQLVFQFPKIDNIIKRKGKKIDYFLSMNLNFTALSKKCKHIQTIHDVSFEMYPKWFCLKRRLWHICVRPQKRCEQSEYIFVPSKHTKSDIEKVYNICGDKIQVLTPGLSKKIYETLKNSNDQYKKEEIKKIKELYNIKKKYIFFLGTLEPRKNIIGSIAAFKHSRLFFQGYELIIAGSKGWKYKNILKSIDQSPGVRYIGYIDKKDKVALYAGADIFLYPSFYEGFGFPPLESLVCGTRPIVSKNSSFFEVIGEQGYFVDPYDIIDISNVLKTCVKYADIEYKHTLQIWDDAVIKFLNIVK
jgi:glycosyltransferase involved in cell wall biosynthesis